MIEGRLKGFGDRKVLASYPVWHISRIGLLSISILSKGQKDYKSCHHEGMIMKAINIYLEDSEYKALAKFKDDNGLTWKELLMSAAKK